MILEFVPGETLRDRLKRINSSDRHMSVTDAIQFAAQICDATDYAHERGVIHRDIKPANIILDIHNQAILMDFGIAKILGGQEHTATGATLGTALYMSPEQIRGVQLDGRSDVYSIGVTLFEMVSGHPPYEGDSAMTLLMMHLNDPVPDVRNLRPGIPNDLVAVIEKALSKDRDQRFRSAADMASALRKVSDRLERVAPDATAGERAEGSAALAQTTVDPARARVTPGSAPVVQTTADPARIAPVAAPPVRAVSSAGPSFADPAPAIGPAPGPPRAASSIAGTLARWGLSPTLVVGAGAGLIALLILGFVILPQLSGGGDETPGVVEAATRTPTVQVPQATRTAADEIVKVMATDEPTPTQQPSDTPEPSPATATLTQRPTATREPTATSVPTPTSVAPTATATPVAPTATVAPSSTSLPPTATYTPAVTNTPEPLPTSTQRAGPYAQISQITVQGDAYVVQYETIGFTESLAGWHTHFFYNTVPPEQAGMPGGGPWIVYYGPSPFTEYKVNSRPDGATLMCVRVANADHTLYQTPEGTLDTGNCYYLP